MLVTFYHLNILWNLPWLFRFIEISPFPLSTRCFWNTKKLYFGSTSVLKSSFPVHRRPKILLVNLWQLMTASNASVRTQAWKVGGFKIPGFVCKLFLPSPPLPLFHFLALVPFFTQPKPKIPLQKQMETLAACRLVSSRAQLINWEVINWRGHKMKPNWCVESSYEAGFSLFTDC